MPDSLTRLSPRPPNAKPGWGGRQHAARGSWGFSLVYPGPHPRDNFRNHQGLVDGPAGSTNMPPHHCKKPSSYSYPTLPLPAVWAPLDPSLPSTPAWRPPNPSLPPSQTGEPQTFSLTTPNSPSPHLASKRKVSAHPHPNHTHLLGLAPAEDTPKLSFLLAPPCPGAPPNPPAPGTLEATSPALHWLDQCTPQPFSLAPFMTPVYNVQIDLKAK